MKLFRRCCQNCSLGVHGTIFQFFEKLVFFISPSDVRREKIRLYVGKKSSGLPKLLSMFHRNNSKKSAFPQKSMSLFNCFGKSANSLASRQKNLDRPVKTAFCLSIGTIWGKSFLRKISVLFIILGLRANFVKILSNNFLRGFQSSILCFHQNVSNKNICFRKKIESFF